MCLGLGFDCGGQAKALKGTVTTRSLHSFPAGCICDI